MRVQHAWGSQPAPPRLVSGGCGGERFFERAARVPSLTAAAKSFSAETRGCARRSCPAWHLPCVMRDQQPSLRDGRSAPGGDLAGDEAHANIVATIAGVCPGGTTSHSLGFVDL